MHCHGQFSQQAYPYVRYGKTDVQRLSNLLLVSYSAKKKRQK